ENDGGVPRGIRPSPVLRQNFRAAEHVGFPGAECPRSEEHHHRLRTGSRERRYELRDFTEAHRDNPNAKDFLVSARESFMEPIRELYAQLRELRSVLKLKEAAAN